MNLRSAAAKLFGLENDEVLIECLKGGVGEAGGAVEDCAAEEDHIEPLDERPAGKAVEDCLLMDASGVKVGVAQCGDERWVLQALVADDQLGLHGGVEIVLLDPTSDAFGEWEVIERIAQLSDGAVDLEDLVDGAGVAGALGTDEANVEGRDLGVLEPGVEEEVAAAHTKRCGLIRGSKS